MVFLTEVPDKYIETIARRILLNFSGDLERQKKYAKISLLRWVFGTSEEQVDRVLKSI